MGRDVDPGLRPCLNCGHPADVHLPIDYGSYTTHDGAIVADLRLGPCIEGDDRDDICPCREWDPDTLSRVSELLGLEVRRAIL